MYYWGISAYYHDSSVALIDDKGSLVDFKKEEWLSRVKGDKAFPRQAFQETINKNELSNELWFPDRLEKLSDRLEILPDRSSKPVSNATKLLSKL